MPSSDIRCTCTSAVESADNCAIHSFFCARAEPASATPDCFAHEQCLAPPLGWTCSRPAGHVGPCAAVRQLREAPTVGTDPIGALRRLADELERSPEKVHAIGVVTLTGHNAIDSYGYGPDGNLAQVSLMFQAAIQRAANGFD